MKDIGDEIETAIQDALSRFNKEDALKAHNPFEEQVSLSSLVDQLSITNAKLYFQKDEVMRRQDDKEFLAWQAIQDIRLVKERARLKKCIDQKIVAMIHAVIAGDRTATINPEVKKYGDNI